MCLMYIFMCLCTSASAVCVQCVCSACVGNDMCVVALSIVCTTCTIIYNTPPHETPLYGTHLHTIPLYNTLPPATQVDFSQSVYHLWKQFRKFGGRGNRDSKQAADQHERQERPRERFTLKVGVRCCAVCVYFVAGMHVYSSDVCACCSQIALLVLHLNTTLTVCTPTGGCGGFAHRAGRWVWVGVGGRPRPCG